MRRKGSKIAEMIERDLYKEKKMREKYQKEKQREKEMLKKEEK